MFRPEDAVTCYVHHAVAHGCSEKNSDRGYDDDAFEWGSLRPHRRVEKVDRVVADTYRQIKHCQQKQEYHDA